ncbi:uncharacterized oxidoreductase YjmC-like [Battus philenor]|uniref:uncharacterized oxidoreductase YjmC-like n=1 Tax=Battus philenor TaxID=42288 RepID=UPI0035D019E6
MSKIATTEVQRFIIDCFRAVGVNCRAAQEQADMIYHADRIGYFSHGLNRLEFYLHDIETGACEPNNVPNVLKENATTAWVDANNVLGATASNLAMRMAIDKARMTGVGWVNVKGSNHNGIGGYWTMKAVKEGLVGIALSNSSPLLAPTRSKKPALGTNPIAFAAPGCEGENFNLDIATTAVSVGKVALYARKGLPLPDGWALGPDGKITNDAALAFKTRRLMPLGGGEESSGYKGYGLSAMVEILCGIAAGSCYGHHIRSWSLTSKSRTPANLGHCFIVMDPECFAPGFRGRLTECMRYWRQMEPVDPKKPVIVPGDVEKEIGDRTDCEGTITYVKRILENAEAIATRLKVKHMAVLPNK